MKKWSCAFIGNGNGNGNGQLYRSLSRVSFFGLWEIHLCISTIPGSINKSLGTSAVKASLANRLIFLLLKA